MKTKKSGAARDRAARAYCLAFGHRLRIVRLALDIPETEAAAQFGVTLRTYRKWEAGGYQNIGVDALVAFAGKYDVSLDWLVIGLADGLAYHLACRTPGKLAILPIKSDMRRRNALYRMAQGATPFRD